MEALLKKKKDEIHKYLILIGGRKIFGNGVEMIYKNCFSLDKH